MLCLPIDSDIELTSTSIIQPTMTSGRTEKSRRHNGNKSSGKTEQQLNHKGARAPGSSTDGAEDDLTSYKTHDTLLIQLSEENPTWFQYGKDLRMRNATILTHTPGPKSIDLQQLASKYRSLVDDIYRRELQLAGKGNNSSDRWVESTVRKGTLKDRIAAMSVIVSNNPVHKFHAIDGLLQMTGSSETGGQTNSRVAQLAAEALEDLFLHTLLPSDRKLYTLEQRPLHLFGSGTSRDNSQLTLSPRVLLLWRFEEMVKEKYSLFISQYLTHTLREGLELSKVSALRTAGTLLRSLPEGESQILALMVNKLGDPGKKTAAAAGHELRHILKEHPNMRTIIAREVQQLAHRPHLSSKALYNCIIFLNQLKLERNDGRDRKNPEIEADSLPASLIKTYFRLFEVAVNSTNSKLKEGWGEIGMKSRLLSALLTGVNRAHPYLPEKDQHMDEHVDELYKVAHAAPPAASTQALLLLFHLSVGSGNGHDDSGTTTQKTVAARRERFYRALYSNLSNPALVAHGKHTTMFFNLLYKAMKYDRESARVVAFAKRVMATTLHCNAPALAATVFLLNEIALHQIQLRSYLEDIPSEHAAKIVLHSSKREPRAALIDHTMRMSQRTHVEEGEAKNASSWELSLVAHHFHPSVAKFGATAGNISYTGDPLHDFSLAPFLDKFAYRNPKSIKRTVQRVKRGESVAERRSFPKGIIDSFMAAPVNDPSFLKRKNIDVQDEFFRKFFVERRRRDEIKGITRREDGAMDEDGALDAAEVAVADDRTVSLIALCICTRAFCCFLLYTHVRHI